jgi:hypothetical protein
MHGSNNNQELVMLDRNSARYLPLATTRTKDVVKHLAPGERRTIDLVSLADAKDRQQGAAWLSEDSRGIHFHYQDGPGGHPVEFGFADQVRVVIEEAHEED